MPKIPTHRRKRLPSTNVGAAPQPVSTANVAGGAIGQGLQALGAGVSQLGQSLQQMKARDDKNKDTIAGKEAENIIAGEEEQYKLKTANVGDPKLREEMRQATDEAVRSRLAELDWGTEQGKKGAELTTTRWSDNFKARVELDTIIRNRDAAIEAAGEKFIADPSPENEIPYRDVLGQRYTPGEVDLIIDKTRTKGLKAIREQAINNTKPAIEAVLIANDYQLKPANKAIDAMVGQMQKSGVLNATEAAEARQDLSNWAADTAAQRRRADKQDAIQIQKGLAEKLADGTYTGDDIALAPLNQTQKKNWDAVTAGARKEPKPPSYEGTKMATQAITDYAIGDIGEIEARQILIDERFKNRSISHDQYRFYLDKIENKYPNHVAENIQTALSAAKTVVHHQGFGPLGIDWVDRDEKEDLIKLNNSLLVWIDDESKDGKYPSGEAIYTKVRELGIPVETPETIDREIPRVIPKQTDPLYDPNDVEVDAMASGTNWYDPVTGRWWKKK